MQESGFVHLCHACAYNCMRVSMHKAQGGKSGFLLDGDFAFDWAVTCNPDQQILRHREMASSPLSSPTFSQTLTRCHALLLDISLGRSVLQRMEACANYSVPQRMHHHSLGTAQRRWLRGQLTRAASFAASLVLEPWIPKKSTHVYRHGQTPVLFGAKQDL